MRRKPALVALLLSVALVGSSHQGSHSESSEAPKSAWEKAPASLRAAYISSRQAEGRSDARHQVRQEDGALKLNGGSGLQGNLDGVGLRLAWKETSARLTTRAVRCGTEELAGSEATQPLSIDGARPNRARRHLGPKVVEWVEAGPLGLEQGWDIDAPDCDGPLEIAIATPGLAPTLEGSGVRLSPSAGGKALRYGDLFAQDAKGQSLPAQLSVRDGELMLTVVTLGATWPVLVDPLVYVEEAKVGPSAASEGAANDYLGFSVSVSGDTAVVGAYQDDVGANSDQGSAYVFVRSGTVWGQQQKLVASDGAAIDYFGYSVSVSGDTAVVGAYWGDVGANANQGSAYVFVRSGTVWSQQQKLTASDGAASDNFGVSVSVSGDTAVVGAYLDVVGANASQGSAYVFVRSGTVWSLQQKLIASDGAVADYLGHSVSVSGDTAVVGAYGDSVGANASQGSAYVFVRSGTVWSLQQKLIASDGAASDYLGYSVSLSGDTAVAGAYLGDVGANSAQGSAYVFVRTGTVWSQQQKLTASDGAASDCFGYSVSVSGDTAVVGSYLDDVGANLGQGSSYVFVRSGTVWSQQQKLTAGDGAAQDSFGVSVSVSGDTAVVGARYDDIGANLQQGSAYAFVRSGTVWSEQQKLTASESAADDYFGRSVSVSGDTAVVGADQDDVGANVDQGSAYVFVRSGTVWSLQQKLTASDGAASDDFGYSVSVSGDTAVVGAYGDDAGANFNQGSAYVFVRSGTVWSQQQKLTSSDGAASDAFGFSVSVSGDTAVVGARYDAVGANPYQGSAYVFLRSGTVWSAQQKLTASDGAADDVFGSSVSVSGDTAVVGAHLDDVGTNVSQGSAYVFVRSGTVWSQQQKLTAGDGVANDDFGVSVSVSGDTAFVGAIADDIGANVSQGSAYVFVRSGTVWSEQQKLTAGDGAANDQFGGSVSASGDTALVGAPGDDVGANVNQGSAYVFVRGGTVWSQQQKLTAGDGAANDIFGVSVAISGQTAAVGAYRKSGAPPFGNLREGAAYLGHLTDPDGGADAGTDGGVDAGTDGGADAGPDGGADLDGGIDEETDGGINRHVYRVGCDCAAGPGDGFFVASALWLLASIRRRRPESGRP